MEEMKGENERLRDHIEVLHRDREQSELRAVASSWGPASERLTFMSEAASSGFNCSEPSADQDMSSRDSLAALPSGGPHNTPGFDFLPTETAKLCPYHS